MTDELEYTQTNIFFDAEKSDDDYQSEDGPGIYVYNIDDRSCLIWLVDGNGDGWIAIAQDRPIKQYLEKTLLESQ